MLIHGTKKVLDLYSIDYEGEKYDNNFIWYANFVTVLRKKMMILMHVETGFCIFVYGLKKSDRKNLDKIIKDAAYVAMKSGGMPGFGIRDFLDASGPIKFTKTSSRSLLSQMNIAMDHAYYVMSEEGIWSDSFGQPHISVSVNYRPTKRIGKDDYYWPSHEMANIVEKYDEEFWESEEGQKIRKEFG